MNAENFSQFLTNPSQLHQISYQELKTLVLQYPYSQPLRYLLMRKAKMDNHEDFDKLLTLAATYSFDREDLFQKVKSWENEVIVEDNYLINEDYLELKDLAILEEEFAIQNTEDTSEELAFSLQEIIDKEKEETPVFVAPTSKNSDNMAEDEQGESLLERLLKDDIEPITHQEEMNTADLIEIRSDVLDSQKEEEIIEASIEAMKTETISDEKIEKIESSPEEWLANAVKEIEEEKKTVEIPEAIIDTEEEGISEVIDNEMIVKEVEESIEIVQIEEEEPINPIEPLELAAETDAKELPFEITNEDLLTIDNNEEKPIPQSKDSFNSWLQQYPHRLLGRKLEDVEADDSLSKKKKKKKKKKAQKIKEKEVLGVAKASVSEDEEIATETLAFILGKQGHYEKAIKMYEQLSLRMPEKSSFFAAKIENLKNLNSD